VEDIIHPNLVLSAHLIRRQVYLVLRPSKHEPTAIQGCFFLNKYSMGICNYYIVINMFYWWCIFLSTVELCSSIEEGKKELETFKMFGDFAIDALKDMDRLSEIISNISESNVEEGLMITRKISSLIGPYSAYVPRVALTIQRAREWLEASKV